MIKSFEEIWCLNKGRTEAMSEPKARQIYKYLLQCKDLEGNIAEAGVFKGAISNLLARMAPNKLIHLFDTWTGLPDTDKRYDLHTKGDFATPYEDVVSFLQDCPNVRFHRGLFPYTTRSVKSEKFCFVHIDFDLYAGTLAGCKFFYPRMSPGGIIIFDDYLWHATPGVKSALDEFFNDKPEIPIVLGPNFFQAIVIKQ